MPTGPLRYARQAEFLPAMQAAAQRYGVPVSLVLAVTAVESAFNPRAYNPNDPGGAWGLMQMIPATARGLGYTGPMDALLTNPSQAIDLGTRLLGDNLKRSGGSVADSVSAYNGGFRPSLGFGAVRANGTYGNQAYVDRVLSEQKYFRGWLGESGGSLGPVLLVLAILAVAYFTFSKGASIP